MMQKDNSQTYLNMNPDFSRRGVSTTEYVLVCAFISAVTISAIFVLGESMNSFLHVADKMAIADANIGKPSELLNVNQMPSLNAVGESPIAFHSQLLALISTAGVLIIGLFYLKLHKKQKSKLASKVCQLDFREQQSEALAKVLNKRSLIDSRLREGGLAMLGSTEIRPYMSTDLVTVQPDMAIEECETLLKENGYRRVLVTDQDGRMAGVISKKDIASKAGKTVGEVMTDKPKTVDPSTNLRFAMSTLVQHRVSCLPIVENGYLVGLLSTSDLIVLLQCILLILDSNTDETPNR